MKHPFILVVDTAMSSLYGDEKNGENFGIIVENKHINGLDINLVCSHNSQPWVFVISTFLNSVVHPSDSRYLVWASTPTVLS